jgi:hypothetical protein
MLPLKCSLAESDGEGVRTMIITGTQIATFLYARNGEPYSYDFTSSGKVALSADTYT